MHADLPESPDLPETSNEATGPAPNEAVPASVEPVNAMTDVTSPAQPAKAAVDSMSPAEPAKAAVDSMSPAACGAKLAELFPALFHPATADAPPPVKPLKLRIQGDILERAPGVFTKRILGIYFSRYTTSNAYLKALTQAPSRFDLDGNAAGEIDIVHRTAAVEELARRRDIAQAKRAELHKAQRQAAQATQNAQIADGPAAAPPVEGAAQPQREGAREPRRDAPPHAPRGARPDARRQEGRESGRDNGRDRPRGPRPDRPPQHGAERAPRPDHANRVDRPARPAPHNERAEPAAPSLPADPAQRERALLLRSFEASPLSKANFCALKRISETDLDAQLTQARAERAGSTAKRG